LFGTSNGTNYNHEYWEMKIISQVLLIWMIHSIQIVMDNAMTKLTK